MKKLSPFSMTDKSCGYALMHTLLGVRAANDRKYFLSVDRFTHAIYTNVDVMEAAAVMMLLVLRQRNGSCIVLINDSRSRLTNTKSLINPAGR